MKRRLRLVMTRGAQTLISVGLVSAAFLVFIVLLAVAFPQGRSLQSLMRDDSRTVLRSNRTTAPLIACPDAGPVALLTHTHHKVTNKTADDLAWRRAQPGLQLGDRHSVQTMDRSWASIQFDDATTLTLDEGSLVIVKHRDPYRRNANRRAELMLMGGTVTGTIGPSTPDSRDVEVVTASSRLRRVEGETEPTEFGVTVDSDGTATYSVYDGQAELSAGDASVVVGPNQSVTTSAEGVAPMQPLPKVPTLVEPDEQSTFRYRSQPPPVRFRWTPDARAERFAFLLAKDPAFAVIIHSTELTGTVFTHYNLADGDYYWRVAGLRDRARGPWSRTGAVHIEQDQTPPALVVEFPSAIVTRPTIRLRGSTEPGARIFVAGAEVEVTSTGTFEHEIRLEPGANSIVVEAVDAAGNTSYRSEFVHAKYQSGE